MREQINEKSIDQMAVEAMNQPDVKHDDELVLGLNNVDSVLPSIEISAVFPKENGEDEFGYYYLKSLTGSKDMWLRLGEFLCMLVSSDKFYFKMAEGKDQLVKLTPKDEENYQEDMDKVEASAFED